MNLAKDAARDVRRAIAETQRIIREVTGVTPTKVRPPYGLLAVLLAISIVISCATSLDRASASYRQNRDFGSLQLIHKHLHKGMPRRQVERVLGEPDYSPTDGQYYYSSSERTRVLVVDYREGEKVTDRLQRFDLDSIGE
jgi:outer membrane protein assembly factor BamE (lipoprotein component of BamABCDE complex)